MSEATRSESRAGLLFALAAFGFWGCVPIYFKAVAHVRPLDVLCHRIVWSVPVIALILSARRGWPAVRDAVRVPRTAATLLTSALLVSVNWLLFIYAVGAGRILEASLGYYVNPLVNVLLGTVFLRERLSRIRVAAVLLAATGTATFAWQIGRLPWISLALAFTFGFYGLLRKTVRIDSAGGLLVETSLLFPVAFAYLAVLAATGGGAFVRAGLATTLLLASAGAVTAVPLIWFASAARRLPYSTIGLVQYVAPTLQFLLAVLMYGERFTGAHAAAFACIWTALAGVSAEALYGQKRGEE